MREVLFELKKRAFMYSKGHAFAGCMLFLATALSVPSTERAEEIGGKRRFEVRDSVEMSYFGTVLSSQPDEMDDDGIVSPDGRYVLKLTHRGVLPGGLTEGTIWLFDAGAVKRSINDPRVSIPKPVPLARMSAAVNGLFNGIDLFDAGNTIFQLQWADDSRSVTFLGRNGRENRQLFRANLDTRKVKALTPENQDVLAYARSSESFAYLAGEDVRAEQAWWSSGPDIPDIIIGTGTPLMPLLYPHFKGNAFGEPVGLEVWQVHNDTAAPIIDPKTKIALRISTMYTAVVLSLSPDATRLATIAYGTPSPAAGESREGASKPHRVLQYRVIDPQRGTNETLVDAPVVDFDWPLTGRYQAAWSPDGTEIALSEVKTTARSEGGRPCTVALVKITTRDKRCVVPYDAKAPGLLYSLRWSRSPDEIQVRYKKSGTSVYPQDTVRRSGTAWLVDKSPRAHSRASLELSVHEALNEVPVLVARDTATGRSRTIFDPNPQLAHIDLGSVSVYEWHDAHRRTIQGGLAKPPGYIPGRRYPLVIQTHGFDAHRFFRVGASDTANAGRALAGRDLIVLQVQEPRGPSSGTWRDAEENGMSVYLAAIDQLAAEGVIDPKKVGITGFSYTGWLVATSITRSPDRFAAAAIANSDPVTLTGYFEYVDTPLAKADANGHVGARPYGPGLQIWVERVPSLSTDKILAPVLFQAADPWHLIGFWDMYAALRDQGKPVELQFIRSGQHIVTKPLHKLTHQEMLVDWFDFWLNGHEEANAEKAGQYVRWRKLQESRDESERAILTPLNP